MIYKYKMKLNGESIKVYLILLACLVVGVGGFFVLGKIAALIVLAVCLYIAYTILKIMAKSLNARITTYTDGFTVRMPDGTKLDFDWNLISYAGYVTEGIQKGYTFVYEESIDKFVQLPPTFENMAGFRAEIEEYRHVEECVMKSGETIKERIKSIFVPEPAENADDAPDSTEADTADAGKSPAGADSPEMSETNSSDTVAEADTAE